MDQFVIACIDSPESAATVLPWARHFAERLNHKGLMALHVSDEGSASAPGWLEQLGVPFVSLKGDWRTAIEGLPTVFGAILAVAAVNTAAPRASITHPHTLLRAFRDCKTAYLCVSQSSGQPVRIPSTALTLTHRREGKEKLVWASYLARFLDSRITIATPRYRDRGLRQLLRNNLRFVEKIFTPLGIEYRPALLEGRQSTLNGDMAVLRQLRPDLIIARTSDPRERDLIDLLLPKPEMQLLTHPSRTPVLFLNPRDDLYILCD